MVFIEWRLMMDIDNITKFKCPMKGDVYTENINDITYYNCLYDPNTACEGHLDWVEFLLFGEKCGSTD